jgi:hypothetical protein
MLPTAGDASATLTVVSAAAASVRNRNVLTTVVLLRE